MSTNKTDAVKASREAAGIKPTSVLFTGADRVRLARLAKKRGESQAAVLRAGLDALEAAGVPTPEEALRVLARALKATR